MGKVTKKPFEGWTEAEFAVDAAERKAALANVASQMEAEIAQESEAAEAAAE